MVAASTQIAADVGAKILNQGGNAFDAAVATAICTSVVDPGDGGLGGGGIAMIYSSHDEKHAVVDFNCRCPTIGDLEKNYPTLAGISEYTGYARVEDEANYFGYRSISVPGAPAGLELIVEKFGNLKLSDLVAPSVVLARHGFEPARYVCEYTDGILELMSAFPETFRIFGESYVPYGDYRLSEIDYAKTLEIFGESGSAGFYDGPIADKITDSMEKNRGLITAEDLRRYKPILGEPGEGSYRDHSIYFQPTGSGSPPVIECLNIAECFDLQKMKLNSPESIHVLIEALKLAWADRLSFDADPDFTKVPLEGMLSKEYAAERSEEIRMNGVIQKSAPGDPWKREKNATASEKVSSHPRRDGGHTSQITVVDKNRNFVSLTQTLWGAYGSLVTIPGTGIVMNNGQSRFDPDPKAANKPETGKRVLSNMSPMLIGKDGVPLAAAGGPGGRRIISTMVRFISNVVDFGMKSDAINQPRFHCETSEPVFVEPCWIDGMPVGVARALESLGHRLEMIPFRGAEYSGYPYISGPASAILVLGKELDGSADFRQAGGISAE